MPRRTNRRPEAAVILAAGLGKRLRPHTLHIPKPLLTVEGTPLIDGIFEALARADVQRVIVVTGHLGDLLEGYVSETFSACFDIAFARQENIIGPADALCRAAPRLRKQNHDPFLVLAADYLLPGRYLKELIDFHHAGIQHISVRAS
jgi:MurNAc alpha-1-phosphate uridylyltransferase